MAAGRSKAYCGISDDHDVMYHVVTFVIMWVVSDFYEFFYHYLGHKYSFLWSQHKHHHVFHNPSPFAVIADEILDQFVRSAPLVILPMLVPINIDMMFLQFAIFFYGYGTYLHWGYESTILTAHHSWINSSYQHYYHHKFAVINRPIYTGFFFKIWDELFGSITKNDCLCSLCEERKGNRTKKQFDEVKKPDYSVLLSLRFWLSKTSSKGTDDGNRETSEFIEFACATALIVIGLFLVEFLGSLRA